MKLVDGREVIDTEVDEDNRLILLVKDDKTGEVGGIHAEEVRVVKELLKPESSIITITAKK